MSAADRTEKVLRDIHILFSKAEPYPPRKGEVIIDKRRMMELLKELNGCIYDIMEEHEMTVQSREAAIRQVKRQNDEQIAEAQKNAEDIYAASIMYSDRALVEIREIVRSSIDDIDALHDELRKKLRKELQTMKTNQYELKSQLQDLIDTDKYLNLIEDENKRIREEKERQEALENEYKNQPDINPYAAIKPEIRVNPAYIPDTEKPLTPEEIAMADAEAKREREKKAKEKEEAVKKNKETDASGDEKKDKKEDKDSKPRPISGIAAAGGKADDLQNEDIQVDHSRITENLGGVESAKKTLGAEDDFDLSDKLVKAAAESISEDGGPGSDEIAATIRAAAMDKADIKADRAVAELAANLDAEYFDWKAEEGTEEPQPEPEEEEPKKGLFSSLFKRKKPEDETEE